MRCWVPVQGEYAVLQKKYQAIKQQRMEELEALMTEQQQRVSILASHTDNDTQRPQHEISLLPCAYRVLKTFSPC